MVSDFSEFKKIDMHSHVGVWGSPFHININEASLMEHMKEYNVEKTLLTGSSAENNQDAYEVCQKHPDQLIPIAWINCAKGQAAYDELEMRLKEQNFKGGKLQSLFDGYAVDSPVVDPVAEICEAHGVPLFVHSGHEPFALPWQIGLLAERHPKLKICMLHMGHGHGIYVDAALQMAKRYPNIWLETSGTSMSAQIYNAYKNVGKEKVMFGLDHPFHAPSVEIQKILACPLEKQDYELIFYENAKAFMGELLSD